MRGNALALRSLFVSAFILLFKLLVVTMANAQNEPPACELHPVLGCETYLTKISKGAGREIGEALASSGDVIADFARTRGRISDACLTNHTLRDNPDRIPEMAHFLELLDEKDRYFFVLQLDYSGNGQSSQTYGQALDRVMNRGNSYDNGIRFMGQEAWSAFMKSANSDRANINHPDIFLQSVTAPSNPEQVRVSEQYRRYLILRNMVELNSLDCNVTSNPDQLWKDTLFAERPWGYQSIREHVTESAMTERYFAAFNQHFTAALMRKAALAVINMHRDFEGLIEIPADGEPSATGKSAHYSLTTYEALLVELRGPGNYKYKFSAFGGALAGKFSIERLDHLPPSE